LGGDAGSPEHRHQIGKFQLLELLGDADGLRDRPSRHLEEVAIGGRRAFMLFAKAMP
jgi:hypothetical protein